jgi:ubiquinone/menaquinone biosynthesis C-methylase UbiE
MNRPTNWRQFWEDKARVAVSDFEVDRLNRPQNEEIEKLAEQELINFIAPSESETLLDAGCGTGVNILRLHAHVKRIFGIDYSSGSLERCQRKIQNGGIKNASIQEASVTSVPLPECSVDKVLCLSVLHYLSDEEVHQALGEFVRVLAPGGIIILHVKNLSSPYWLTLQPVKKLKALLTNGKLMEHVRSFRWYVRELASFGCSVVDYDSFNLLMIDKLPQRLVTAIREFEIRHHRSPLFRKAFLRRHGAELLIKAKVTGVRKAAKI